jgi:hypothetical protein
MARQPAGWLTLLDEPAFQQVRPIIHWQPVTNRPTSIETDPRTPP